MNKVELCILFADCLLSWMRKAGEHKAKRKKKVTIG